MSEISRFSRNSSFFNISVVTSKKSQKNSSDARDALGNFRFLGPYRLSMYEAVFDLS